MKKINYIIGNTIARFNNGSLTGTLASNIVKAIKDSGYEFVRTKREKDNNETFTVGTPKVGDWVRRSNWVSSEFREVAEFGIERGFVYLIYPDSGYTKTFTLDNSWDIRSHDH